MLSTETLRAVAPRGPYIRAQQAYRDTEKQQSQQFGIGMGLSPLLDEVKLNAEVECPVGPWSRHSPG